MKHRYALLLIPAFLSFFIGCAGGGGTKTSAQRQSDAIRQLGEAYLNEKNYTQALAQFLKAEKLAPKDHLLHQDLGIAYMAKEDVETAVIHFKKALEIKPDYASARNNLGAAYLALKDWDAAIEAFKLLTKDLLYATPHYPLTNLGKAYFEKKEFAEAEKYYLQAIKAEPGFVNALYGLGKTYLAMGKVPKAVEYFEYAVEGAPQLAQAQFDLAEGYRLLGNTEKAKEGYTKVIALSPDSDLGRNAKQAVFDLK